MKLLRTAVPALLALLSVAGGCHKTEPPGRPYDRIRLEMKGQSLIVEVASHEHSRTLGLMHRESLPANEGMLFIFPKKRLLSFWMRNTTIPLSIAFIDDEGVIFKIEDMQPLEEKKRARSEEDCRYALEVNQGWFTNHGIGVGDRIDEFRAKVSRFRAQ